MPYSWMLLADGSTEAQKGEEPAQKEEKPQPPSYLQFWFVPLMIAVVYFLVLRPNRRQDKLRQAFLANLKKNDKVQTSGGILGSVVSVSDDKSEVVLRVDDNARIRMMAGHIVRNITQEEAAKPAKEQPKETKDEKTA